MLIGIITTVGEGIINAQFDSSPDNLRLGQVNERRVNRKRRAAADRHFRRQIRQLLERRDEFRPAVGIAAVIDRVDADEHIPHVQHFRPGQGIAQKDRVSRGHVSNRDLRRHLLLLSIFGNRDVIG